MFRGWEEMKKQRNNVNRRTGFLDTHCNEKILGKSFLYLGSIQVVRLHIGWLVSLRLLGEWNGCAYKAEERTMFKTKRKKRRLRLLKNLFPQTYTSKLTGLWSHCSSNWGGSRSWAPRRRGVWCARRERRRCGWPHGTWHQSCPGSCAWTGVGGLVCWSPAATPAPGTEGRRIWMTKSIEDMKRKALFY